MLRFGFFLTLIFYSISIHSSATARLDVCLAEIDSNQVLKYFDDCGTQLTSDTTKNSSELKADVVNIINSINLGYTSNNATPQNHNTINLFRDMLALYELLIIKKPHNGLCSTQETICDLLFNACEFPIETNTARLNKIAISAAKLASALTAYSINEEKNGSRFLTAVNLATNLKLLMQEETDIYDAKLIFKSKKLEEFKEIRVWKNGEKTFHVQNLAELNNYDNMKRHAWFHHWDRADVVINIPSDSYPDYLEFNRVKYVSGIFFDCQIPTLKRQISLPFLHTNGKIRGILVVTVSKDNFDLLQCGSDINELSNNPALANKTKNNFSGTNKCDTLTTTCINIPGKGFHLNAYTCKCKPGFFPKNDTNISCQECSEGCTICTDSKPCRVRVNLKLKQICLFVNILFILICAILIVVIFYHMSRKMLNSSSPEMLIMVLIGAIVSYCELIPMYFEPSRLTCTIAQVLQLQGFLLAYGALVLKTWRECKLFYVRSVKTIKISEKSMLNRLALIMLVGTVYLMFWALRKDGPHEMEMTDVDGLKYSTCTVSEWNYISILIQFAVLSYGVVQSIHVRRASIAFKETKLITWAIFNECFFKVVVVLTMIFVIQNKDLRVYVYFSFLHAFLRTHLTVSIMVMLIFIYKIYTIVAASKKPYQSNQSALLNNFNTIGGNDGDAKNSSVCEEKETEKEKELKIEIMRLCRQLEETRSLSMRIANPHLLTKKSRFINYPNKKAKTKYLLPLDNVPEKSSQAGEACLTKMNIEEGTDKVKS